MRAAYREHYGPPEKVSVREIDRPEPTGDQVLVKVAASSVNRADLDGLYPRWKFLRLVLGVRRPRNPLLGSDVAGTVESVGPDVAGFKVGDRVYGDLYTFGAGAFAEYVCPPERALRRIPDDISFADAATLPHSAVLAIQGLGIGRSRHISAGDAVMINGASGNVGPFAVQIAKHVGALVTGVASTSKLDLVRAAGADHVVDYTKVDPRHTGERFDWIVDVDAHNSVLSWRKALNSKGVYVAMGGSGAWLLSLPIQMAAARLATDKSMGLLLAWKPFNGDDVATIEQMMAQGTLRPTIDRTFALDEIVDALRYVDSGKSRGKVLVEP